MTILPEQLALSHPSFLCSITHEVMRDPVMDREGNSYERSAIEQWIQIHGTSPITRSPLAVADLVSNRSLRESIQETVEKLQSSSEASSIQQGNAVDSGDSVGVPAVAEGASVCSVDSCVVGNGDDSSSVEKQENRNISVKTSIQQSVENDKPVYEVHVSIDAPHVIKDGEQRLMPADICCVIDVSGSMGDGADAPGGLKSKETGLSLLDITKHAVHTVIATLQPTDRLSLVTFTGQADVALELTYMDEAGKNAALKALERMTPLDSTNLWDGLYRGLEVLHNSANLQANGAENASPRTSALMLLTDGMPNVEPPRGHVPMLQKYITDHKNRLKCTINCFGFGYSMDSALLDQLSTLGGGSYGFIPDSGFVGTIFVNSLSNILSLHSRNLSVDINFGNKADEFQIVDYVSGQLEVSSSGIKGSLGTLQYGQSRDIYFKVKPKVADCPITGTVSVSSDGFGDASFSAASEFSYNKKQELTADQEFDIALNYARTKMVNCVKENVTKPSGASVDTCIKELEATKGKLEFLNKQQTALYDSILEDLGGQVKMAVGNSFYGKWGKHYLPSLLRAHVLQQCNNFKDAGVQQYGRGQLFSHLREVADDIFLKLPPPKPSIKPSDNKPLKPVRMSSFHSSHNTCFAPWNKVLMADGSYKLCKDIAKGDLVKTFLGNSIAKSSASVICVVKTHCKDGRAPLSQVGNLVVTPWHPIKYNGTWSFPVDVGDTSERDCAAVYSYVLDMGHNMIIEGFDCVTLGHDFKGDLREHHYFGSQLVINDLKNMNGWEAGLVELETGCMRRVNNNGIMVINALVQSPRFAAIPISVCS